MANTGHADRVKIVDIPTQKKKRNAEKDNLENPVDAAPAATNIVTHVSLPPIQEQIQKAEGSTKIDLSLLKEINLSVSRR